jgi:hypothetical protein
VDVSSKLHAIPKSAICNEIEGELATIKKKQFRMPNKYKDFTISDTESYKHVSQVKINFAENTIALSSVCWVVFRLFVLCCASLGSAFILKLPFKFGCNSNLPSISDDYESKRM